jgi:hypothetical protein
VAVSDEDIDLLWKAIGALALSMGSLRSIVIKLAYQHKVFGWQENDLDEFHKQIQDSIDQFGEVIKFMNKHYGRGD